VLYSCTHMAVVGVKGLTSFFLVCWVWMTRACWFCQVCCIFTYASVYSASYCWGTELHSCLHAVYLLLIRSDIVERLSYHALCRLTYSHTFSVWLATPIHTVICHVKGLYTVSQKKLCHFYFYCNFGKCWSIFKILSMSESERNGS